MILAGLFVLLILAAMITYIVLKGPLTVKLPAEASVPDQPVSFGYKNTWLAVKAENTKAIAESLGDPKAQTCNWKTGVERAYRVDQLFAFVTPPLAGWTLVVGYALPSADTKGSEEAVVRLIDRLSAKFGEAQWFTSHRVVEYHGWAKSISGRTIRHYSYLGEKGETLSNQGEPTPAEPARLFDSSGPEQQVSVFPDEETVMQIAAAWSVAPCKIEERNLPAGLGLLLLASPERVRGHPQDGNQRRPRTPFSGLLLRSSCEALRTTVR